MFHRFDDHPISARFKLSAFFLSVGFLPLSGCMIGMHGVDSDTMRQGHPMEGVRPVEKTFAEKGQTISLEIPSLVKGWESTFMVRIRETAGGEPVVGSKVMASVRWAATPREETLSSCVRR